MSTPSGEIIARPMVARACGCMQEFQHFAVDKYRAQRLAKFQKTRCSACVTKLNEEQKKAAAALPKKGEALQLLPIGTKVSMNRRPDGSWAGTLAADGITVEAIADGPQGLSVSLARLWVSNRKPSAQSSPAQPSPIKATQPTSGKMAQPSPAKASDPKK